PVLVDRAPIGRRAAVAGQRRAAPTGSWNERPPGVVRDEGGVPAPHEIARPHLDAVEAFSAARAADGAALGGEPRFEAIAGGGPACDADLATPCAIRLSAAEPARAALERPRTVAARRP